MKKVKYKIIKSNGLWKFRVYKKVFGIWINVYGTDHETNAEHYIRDTKSERYFDKEGNEL